MYYLDFDTSDAMEDLFGMSAKGVYLELLEGDPTLGNCHLRAWSRDRDALLVLAARYPNSRILQGVLP